MKSASFSNFPPTSVIFAFALASCSSTASAPSATPLPAAHPSPINQDLLYLLKPSKVPATGFVDEVGVAGPNEAFVHRDDRTFTADSTIVLRGWGMDAISKAPGGGLVLIVNNERRDVSYEYGFPRLDIAKVYVNPALLDTGFIVHVPAASLQAGRDELQLGLVSIDRTSIYPFTKSVLVTINVPHSPRHLPIAKPTRKKP